MENVRIIQLPIFTQLVGDLLSDLEYWELQDMLAAHPDAGDLIPGGKGLRKLRWSVRRLGRGKRGGVRVIYYWRPHPGTVYFVTIYAKSRQDDLTRRQLAALAALVERELK
jgi:mRNA-degrading endonuclease RelE of RelBE toxin-antitoxin system